MVDITLGHDFKKKHAEEALRGVLRLPFENADFAGCQVEVRRVHSAKLTKPPQQGSKPDRSSESLH